MSSDPTTFNRRRELEDMTKEQLIELVIELDEEIENQHIRFENDIAHAILEDKERFK